MAGYMDLINQAHMALDAAEKVDILQRVKDIVLDRSSTIVKSVPEYKAVMDAIVQFTSVRNVGVAKFVLQFIEDVMDPTKNSQIKSPPVLAQTRLTLFEACSSILTINAGPSSTRKALKLLDKYIPGTIYHLWTQQLEVLDPQVWDALTRNVKIMQETLHQFQDPESVIWIIRNLECCALHFSPATDSVYRDPARSNIQPDAVNLDTIASGHAFLRTEFVMQIGFSIVMSLVERLQSAPNNPMLTFGRREYLTLLQTLSILAVLRPDFVPHIIPCLLSVPTIIERLPTNFQETLIHATKASLVKLLQFPSTAAFRNPITEFLIAYGLSERAFKALSKSKDRRRKYVNAPSNDSLRNVRRDTARMSFEMPLAKRSRREPAASVTIDSVVNMATESVIQLVLNNMNNLPTVVPLHANGEKLQLLHTPSGLKDRMISILSRLATPSSVLAIKEAEAKKNVRDPRLRGREKIEVAPSLVTIFDEDGVEAVTDMICANTKTLVEPIIAVTKDEISREYNAIKVNIKPVTADWCKQMAQQTIQRLLGNEYGVVVSGKEHIREALVCRLATSRWLVDDDKCKPHRVIVDFVGENIHKRHSIIVSLLYHEYTTSLYETMELSKSEEPRVYTHLVSLVCSLLRTKLDPKVPADKKLFYHIMSHIPCLTVDVLKLLSLQFHDATDKDRVTMGVVALRNFITERTTGQAACLQVLLHFSTHKEESIRVLTIKCLANQIYPLPNLPSQIEAHATKLMESLYQKPGEPENNTNDVDMNNESSENSPEVKDIDIKVEKDESTALLPTSPRRKYYLDQIASHDMNDELLQYAKTLQSEHDFSGCPQTEQEVLQRMELFLALCAKRPDLFSRFVTTYALTSPEVQHVLLVSVDKLVKHLRQKEGESVVLQQLESFPPKALDFVLHVVKQLVTLSKEPSTLVEPLYKLYTDNAHAPDAISILIPIASELSSERVMESIPLFFDLSLPRLVEVMQELLKPIPLKVDASSFLLALHHIPDENEKQKRILRAIGLCLEHPVAFPVEVMSNVTSTLVAETPVPKYTLRTMIQAVQMHPKLRKHTAACLETLLERRIWEMDESLWIGWMKCSVVIQPHSFKAIASLPLAQGRQIFEMEEGKELLDQFKSYCQENYSIASDEWREHFQLEKPTENTTQEQSQESAPAIESELNDLEMS